MNASTALQQDHSAADARPVALITGASSGIGLATARRCAQLGYRVFGTSRSGQAIDPGVFMLTLDVDRDDSVTDCIAALLRQTSRLDLVVNNAGRALAGACEETSPDEARALFETNVFGPMRVIRAVLPTMRQQASGTIINVGSLSGSVGVPFHGVYAASKHALAGYSEALRLELRPFGIRVSVIEPQAHRTQIQMGSPARPMPLYYAGRQHVEALIRQQIEAGDSPERVVDAILAAARARAPALRYPVGRSARFATWARRLLPARVFEHFLRREFLLPAS
jgi:NAD(P)-dependent dehydrogenase (short-subunit alcohol dehydrogenase family)